MAEELAGPAFYSYNLTVETKVNIDELIYILSPKDLPLLHGVGADGVPLLPRVGLDNTVFYWLEEEVPLPRAILNEDLDGSETDVTLSTGEAVKFAVGDAIRIDDEVMIVTAINTSTEVLTVTRGSSTETNTDAASHTTGAEVIGLGTVLVEGSIGSANFQGRDKYSNYAQIWSKKTQVSRTEQRIPKYGVPNELNKQMMNAMQHLTQGVEQAALYGVKHQHATTNRRQTGGFDHFVTTNVNSSDTWLTVESIEDMLQLAYNQGGSFEYIMAQPAAFGALNNLAGNERVTTVTIDDARRGRQRARVVMTEFGDVQLVRNRWMKKSVSGSAVGEAFGFSRENFIYRVFQPLITEKLAKTDDTDTYMMVCEGGFEVKGQDHMAKWTGLDFASAMPVDLV
jgi:hypothetical protein